MDVKTDESLLDGPWYESDESAIARVQAARRSSARFCESWVEQATTCMRFVAGHQWTDEEENELREQEKPNAKINQLARLVNVVCGQQVANRQELTYLGRKPEDAGGAEVQTDVARWVRDLGDEEYEESQAFRDLLTTGMGWTSRSMEYDEDEEGKICKERFDPRRFRWDTAARRPGLANARWIQCDHWYSRDDIRERWGEEALESLTINPEATHIDAELGGTLHNADTAWEYEKSSAAVDQRNGEFRVIHHVEWCRHAQYDVVADDGAMITLDEEQFKVASDRAEQMGQPVPQHAKRLKRRYYHVWTVAGTVLERGEAVLQTGFPYQCMTGIRDDDTGHFLGLIHYGIDPQRFINTLLISTLHALKSNAKGGVMAETDAVDNVRKFEEDWAKSNAISWVRPGAIAAGKIQPKSPPVLPQQLATLTQFLVETIPSIVGVAPELLSQAESAGQPGVVEELRTQAGLTMLTSWFDAVRLYMKRDGRVLLEMINRFIADGRVARIVGKAGEQFIPVTREPNWARYSVAVDESTITRDAKGRAFHTLMAIAPQLAQMGISPPQTALDYLPLPQGLIQDWKKELAEKAQQPPPPTEKEKLEQLRVQGQIQLEQVKQDGKMGAAEVDAARRTEVEMAQAAARERENASTLQMKREEMQLTAQLRQMEAVMDARLTTFETILKAIVDGFTAMQSIKAEQDSTIAALRAEKRPGLSGERSSQ